MLVNIFWIILWLSCHITCGYFELLAQETQHSSESTFSSGAKSQGFPAPNWRCQLWIWGKNCGHSLRSGHVEWVSTFLGVWDVSSLLQKHQIPLVCNPSGLPFVFTSGIHSNQQQPTIERRRTVQSSPFPSLVPSEDAKFQGRWWVVRTSSGSSLAGDGHLGHFQNGCIYPQLQLHEKNDPIKMNLHSALVTISYIHLCHFMSTTSSVLWAYSSTIYNLDHPPSWWHERGWYW
jgi:hypothetical protein